MSNKERQSADGLLDQAWDLLGGQQPLFRGIYPPNYDPEIRKQAEGLIKEAIRVAPDYARGEYLCGEVLRQAGKLADAEKCCRHSIELDRGFIGAHRVLAHILYDANGRQCTPEAERKARHAIELDPEFPLSHTRLGFILSDQPAKAEPSYRRALELDPDYYVNQHNLAATLCDLQRPVEAEECSRRAVELGPDHALSHSVLGIILHDQGKRPEAEQSCRHAIALDPDLAFGHFALGMVAEEEQSFARGIALDHNGAVARYFGKYGRLTSESYQRARKAGRS